MEQRQFFEGITVISQFFGSPWPNEAIGAAYGEVKDLSVDALKAAHKRIYVEFQPRPLPAINRIITVIKEEQQKINLSTSPAEPKSRQRNDQEFQEKFGQAASDYHKASANICIKIATGEMSFEEAVNACSNMETKFPGLGWRETQMFYIQRVREKTELRDSA